MSMKFYVGAGSCGIAAGAAKVVETLKAAGCDVRVVGCVGLCRLEPLCDVRFDDGAVRTYVRLDEAGAAELAKLGKGEANAADRYMLSGGDAALLNAQTRVALRNCGKVDPADIDDYIARGGYEGLKRALAMTPEGVIDEIKASGLAGRGGAGFPTWFKWDAARKAAGNAQNDKISSRHTGSKFGACVICNADEGDPGAFMDRAIIEGDPHAVIEGMLTAAYAVGASAGYVYIRAEYPLAVERLETAVKQARERGLLENFDLKIARGAGAFVCGEETALIAGLEGERGMPRLKPPFPAQSGLWGSPTNINNVETYANVPFIMREGAAAFNRFGTADSKGAKVFAVTGKAAKGGLVETPMGVTLRHVIFDLCGGIRNGKAFKAVQLGGPSGGCLPESLLDTVVDYKELAKTGAIMGSGGMVVMDEDACMVDMARFFLNFTRYESCGKCVHCRVGTKRMLEVLERICQGGGKEGDVESLIELGEQIKAGALCGLGQTAPNPVLTAIRYFRDEFDEHIRDKSCRAGVCPSLYNLEISDRCKSCGACMRVCPVGAITKDGKTFTIDAAKCVKCGRCAGACKFGAVGRERPTARKGRGES